MELDERRDQFAFFLGYLFKAKGRALQCALEKHTAHGYASIKPQDVFEYCPFNDSYEQILHSLRVSENLRPKDFSNEVLRLIAEFVFLVSDFEPPCCGDGRAFYCLDRDRSILLKCDRCETKYDLDENRVVSDVCREMTRQDFLSFCEVETAALWPLSRSDPTTDI